MIYRSVKLEDDGRLELGFDASTRRKDYVDIRRSAWNSGVQAVPRFGNLRSPVREVDADTRVSRRQADGLPVEHRETSGVRLPNKQETSSQPEIGGD
jgi:hypothetical protein